MYIFLSEVRLAEEEEYKNYLRVTPKCLDELFVPVKYYITKKTTTVRDAGSAKPKHCTKNEVFH